MNQDWIIPPCNVCQNPRDSCFLCGKRDGVACTIHAAETYGFQLYPGPDVILCKWCLAGVIRRKEQIKQEIINKIPMKKWWYSYKEKLRYLHKHQINDRIINGKYTSIIYDLSNNKVMRWIGMNSDESREYSENIQDIINQHKKITLEQHSTHIIYYTASSLKITIDVKTNECFKHCKIHMLVITDGQVEFEDLRTITIDNKEQEEHSWC